MEYIHHYKSHNKEELFLIKKQTHSSQLKKLLTLIVLKPKWIRSGMRSMQPCEDIG